MAEVLQQPLHSLPFQQQTEQSETSRWVVFPSKVVHLPEYYKQDWTAYEEYSCSHPQPVHRSPDYANSWHAIRPGNGPKLGGMFGRQST